MYGLLPISRDQPNQYSDHQKAHNSMISISTRGRHVLRERATNDTRVKGLKRMKLVPRGCRMLGCL